MEDSFYDYYGGTNIMSAKFFFDDIISVSFKEISNKRKLDEEIIRIITIITSNDKYIYNCSIVNLCDFGETFIEIRNCSKSKLENMNDSFKLRMCPNSKLEYESDSYKPHLFLNFDLKILICLYIIDEKIDRKIINNFISKCLHKLSNQ